MDSIVKEMYTSFTYAPVMPISDFIKRTVPSQYVLHVPEKQLLEGAMSGEYAFKIRWSLHKRNFSYIYMGVIYQNYV